MLGRLVVVVGVDGRAVRGVVGRRVRWRGGEVYDVGVGGYEGERGVVVGLVGVRGVEELGIVRRWLREGREVVVGLEGVGVEDGWVLWWLRWAEEVVRVGARCEVCGERRVWLLVGGRRVCWWCGGGGDVEV